MGLFVKVKPADSYNKNSYREIGWRQILDEDIEDYRDGEDVLCYNSAGGRCPIDGFKVLEEVEADCFENLDWTDTWMDPKHNKWNGNGWIDRDGHVYPCGWMEHDNIAYYYLKSDITELENKGWIRVMYDVPVYRGKLTQAQYNKCKDLGIDINEENVLWQ